MGLPQQVIFPSVCLLLSFKILQDRRFLFSPSLCPGSSPHYLSAVCFCFFVVVFFSFIFTFIFGYVFKMLALASAVPNSAVWIE